MRRACVQRVAPNDVYQAVSCVARDSSDQAASTLVGTMLVWPRIFCAGRRLPLFSRVKRVPA